MVKLGNRHLFWLVLVPWFAWYGLDGLRSQTRIDAPQLNIVFVDNEIPVGAIDGNNRTFILAAAPNPPNSLHLYRDGLRGFIGLDFYLSGNTITYSQLAPPQPGTVLLADYRK